MLLRNILVTLAIAAGLTIAAPIEKKVDMEIAYVPVYAYNYCLDPDYEGC